ncbi:MAG: STAS domain-containing protein [Aquabacterium sp.]
MNSHNITIADVIQTQQEPIVAEWLTEANLSGKGSEQGRLQDAKRILNAFLEGLKADGDPTRFEESPWSALRQVLGDLSASRAAQGASAGETSVFVLSMKKPIFERLQQRLTNKDEDLVASLWWLSTLVDKCAQFTVTTYQNTREDIIHRQQQELLELSTPVIKLWDGVLAVPMIGTLDSSRTQLVMETLLQRIVETGSELAIIDITGVPTVDTLVAQHLLKTVTAIRLMGAECIISGIRPQIAQTIVHLGIDLQGITTKATLADALAVAFKMAGYTIGKTKS